MSNLSNFVNTSIVPKLFEVIDKVFPEFEFHKSGGNWVSGNKLRLTGAEGHNVGSVIVYSNTPFYIQDFSSGGKAIITYVQTSGRATSWFSAAEWLASKTGLELPKTELIEAEVTRYEELNQRVQLLETVNHFFLASLSTGDDSKVCNHREYLKARGYTDLLKTPSAQESPFKSNLMELGFVPSQSQIREHLRGKGYTDEQINTHLLKPKIDGANKSLHPSVGDSHCLSLPFRDPVGRILGFCFRNISWSAASTVGKYIYSTGLKRGDQLFNLRTIRGDQDLVIVEGLLDALYIRALGIDNIVALGATGFNAQQIALVRQQGAQKITLCLDSDEAGRKATEAALEAIQRCKVDLKVYVAELPQGFKDPDELIREQGIDAFKLVVFNAESYYIYLLNRKCESLSDLTDKTKDAFILDLIKIGAQISDPIEKDLYTAALFKKTAALEISKEAIEQAIENSATILEKEQWSKEFEGSVKAADKLVSSGNIEEAHALLSSSIQKPVGDNLEVLYRKLGTTTTEEQVTEALKILPDSISSGFSFKSNKLYLPAGAISIFAGPTSHGKTSYLINLALNMVLEGADKPIYLFSYEESKEAILLKALNTFMNLEFNEKYNRLALGKYFKTGSTSMIKAETLEQFKAKKDQFFKELVNTGKLHVHYVDFTAEELVGAIRHLHKNNQVGAVLIDYMQLLRMKKNPGKSRQEELKQICIELKNCAVDTGLPIILGAQFNRSVIEIAKIHATAIGEAGDIERIANLIIGFWNKQFPEVKDTGGQFKERTKSVDEIYAVILKGRDIGSGEFDTFSFNGNTGKISELKKEEKDERK